MPKLQHFKCKKSNIYIPMMEWKLQQSVLVQVSGQLTLLVSHEIGMIDQLSILHSIVRRSIEKKWNKLWHGYNIFQSWYFCDGNINWFPSTAISCAVFIDQRTDTLKIIIVTHEVFVENVLMRLQFVNKIFCHVYDNVVKTWTYLYVL